MKEFFVVKWFRYAVFAVILSLALGASVYARGARVNTIETRLYFVDAEMLRLVPVTMSIPEGKTQRMAQRVCDEIVKGRDENPKIRRIIPNVKRGLSVKVKNGCAYVNISRQLAENHPDGRDLEILSVYQIVNSLAEIDGVVTVRFTVDGEVTRNFMGYLDMRETFVPDYFV